MVATFNDGAKTATGEFLVRLDADDLLTPGSLARATQLARAYPSVGLVYGHPIHFSTESLPESRKPGVGVDRLARTGLAEGPVPLRAERHHLAGGAHAPFRR